MTITVTMFSNESEITRQFDVVRVARNGFPEKTLEDMFETLTHRESVEEHEATPSEGDLPDGVQPQDLQKVDNFNGEPH